VGGLKKVLHDCAKLLLRDPDAAGRPRASDDVPILRRTEHYAFTGDLSHLEGHGLIGRENGGPPMRANTLRPLRSNL